MGLEKEAGVRNEFPGPAEELAVVNIEGRDLRVEGVEWSVCM